MEKLIKKAWKISAKNLSEPWYFEDVTVMADTRGEARSLGLSELIYQGATKNVNRKYDDDTITYTDIVATRYKAYDRILFEGKEIASRDLEGYLWCKERDENALQLTNTNPNDLAIVYAGCYGQYWGANHSGYSSVITFAGKYTTLQAYDIVRGSSYDRKETVSLLDVEQFNAELDLQIYAKETEIERLKTYIING